MGKTYRKDSDGGKRQPREKNKRKPKNKKQTYGKFRYDTLEERESHWDDYSASEEDFEKFSSRNKKR